MTETSSAAASAAAAAPADAAAPAATAPAAAVTAVMGALLPQRPPAPAGAGAPAAGDGDSDTNAAAPQLLRSALATRVAARSAPQSASSDMVRIDGGSQSASAREPAGTVNDLNNLTGALPPAAAPDPAAQTGATPAPEASNATVPGHAYVGSSGWANELGARLHWMVSAGLGSASLRLTPEQLGPVEVRISVHQNAASVWFSATQPDTRSALEQSLPRLRELFSAQGMNLAQAGVSDQSARSTPQEPQAVPVTVRPASVRGLNATSVTSAPRAHQGLIDTYA